MPIDPHGQAHLLIDRGLVEEISAEDRRWLDAHLAHCEPCTAYAALTARAVRALDAFAFDFDPAAAMRVESAVRRRAAQLAAARPSARILWLASAAALLLTAAGSLAMWQLAQWLAGRWNLPSPAWQIAFAACWPLPSLLLAALPFLRDRLLEQDRNGDIL